MVGEFNPFIFKVIIDIYDSIGLHMWLSGKKKLPEKQEMWIQSLGHEESLEKEMAIHSSILASEVLWEEEPGGQVAE